ncbi:hypothetical protein KAI04_04370 [Candidatus Pacearchaeota archaeon]|nr:hypothetical protein [Candidatus Pacearchaeota archaeon]
MKKKYEKEKLEELYITKNMTAKEVADIYNVKHNTMRKVFSRFGIKKEIIEQEPCKLEKILDKHNISEDELKSILKSTKKSKPESGRLKYLDFKDNHIKFTVISDLHLGHNRYRPDILEHAIENSKKQGSEFYCIPGDIIEGMSGRDGHIYELSHIGATNQLNYAIEQLSQIDKPMYAITARNSHDGWFSSKGNMGFEVGPELDRRLENFEFLGYDEADIELGNKIKIKMTHPGDGTAYAVSYKAQKYLNALPGGQKPDILLQGHYHKAMYMFYRNVHHFDAGTLCDQTIFMKKKQTPAMTGYWIIDAWANDKGVDRIKSEFVPFWE